MNINMKLLNTTR